MHKHHVGVRVIAPEQRDVFQTASPEEQDSWSPVSSDGQPPVGEEHEYTAELSEETADRFRAASNLRYLVPVEEAHVHEMLVEGRVSASTFPAPDELAYHRADGLEDAGYDGEGVICVNADTGLSSQAERYYPGRIIGRRDYTGKGSTEDGHGHGSATSSLQVPSGAELYVCKVLSDSGSGSSDGIARSIRLCGDLAAANPGKQVIGNYSLGGSSFEPFQPYQEAIAYAESKGALILCSAGNDGKYGISAPANSKPGIASIAFGLSDRRANFSNHHESGGCAAIGERALVIDRNGSYARMSGTSFSCPWWARIVAMLCTPTKKLGSAHTVHRGLLANARDTPESVEEEAAGAINAKAAISKLQPERKPKPDPRFLIKKRWSAMQLRRMIERIVERGGR